MIPHLENSGNYNKDYSKIINDYNIIKHYNHYDRWNYNEIEYYIK